MAKVTMLIPVSGVREGVPWPSIGGNLNVPQPESDELIAAGIAKAWKASDDPHAATLPVIPDEEEPQVETATKDNDVETPEKKPARATKAAAAKKKPAAK